MTHPTTRDEAAEPYQGTIGPLAAKYGLAWALGADGAYVGGGDRESDLHFFAWDRGAIVGILKFSLRRREIRLEHLLIAPAHRDRGRAGRLLDRFLEWCGQEPELEGCVVSCEITGADRERVEGMLADREFEPDGQEWRLSL
jgi:GNAT superfamily N-acetyltransferase